MRADIVLLGALTCAPAAAMSQAIELPRVRYPALPAASPTADGFVPRGWAVVGRESGDLNGDGRADIVLLMQMRDRANVVTIPWGSGNERFDTNPHLLAAAFREPGGGYRLAATNHGLFQRPFGPHTGDDPIGEDTISIERRALLVSFGYLRGHASYRFRWQSGAFRLVGYEQGGVSGGCVETHSINYLTRRARVTKGMIDSDRTRVAWLRLAGPPPPTLDGLDLDTFRPDQAILGPLPECPFDE